MSGKDVGVLGEREVARLLKRIDGMIPVEESERLLLKSSKRAAYGRFAVAITWVVVFGSMWALAYYSILSGHSESLSYILPRLSVSAGLVAAVIFMRFTDRLKLRWAMVAAVGIMIVSRAMV